MALKKCQRCEFLFEPGVSTCDCVLVARIRLSDLKRDRKDQRRTIRQLTAENNDLRERLRRLEAR